MYYRLKVSWANYAYSLLIACIFTLLFSSSCKKAPLAPEDFEANGEIQGQVIDKGSGEALSDIEVTLLYRKEDGDGNLEDSTKFKKVTDSQGRFTFQDVPVNADAKGSNIGNTDKKNQAYTIKLDLSNKENYRDNYLMYADVVFESTGGDGAAVNLVSNITIPLNKMNATVRGKLFDSLTGEPLVGSTVKIYQRFNPIINGNSATESDLYLTSTTSSEDGTFEFNEIEEDAQIFFKVIDRQDPSEVYRTSTGNYTTPVSGDSETSILDVGRINVSPSNETGPFYIKEITPEAGADIDPNEARFVFVFNRPVKQLPYTRTDLGFGSGTMIDDIGIFDLGSKKAVTGDIDFEVQWSANYDSLTIIPENLRDANNYRLDFNSGPNNDVFDLFEDENENSLSFGGNLPYIQLEAEERVFSTNANNAKPHTPVLEVDSTSNTIDYNNGDISYSFNIDESEVDVKEYEFWIKFGDEPYELEGTISRSDITFGKWEALAGPSYSDPLVILRGPSVNIPEEARDFKFKVRAISNNLREGDFSNEITASDIIKPDISSANYNDAAGELTIEFDEPMVKSQVEDPANYSFEDNGGNTISGVNIANLEYSADYGPEVYEVVITLENPSDLNSGSGETVIVSTNVTDLAGNGIDTSTTDTNNDNDSQTNEATY